MKLQLTSLDPHFLKRVSPVDYEHTDNIREAEGLELQCPACCWADRRFGGDNLGHMMVLWRDREHWGFAGHGYGDLSLKSGDADVTMSGGACRASFMIKDGRVDFY